LEGCRHYQQQARQPLAMASRLTTVAYPARTLN
jgi:hypothetical protein